MTARIHYQREPPSPARRSIPYPRAPVVPPRPERAAGAERPGAQGVPSVLLSREERLLQVVGPAAPLDGEGATAVLVALHGLGDTIVLEVAAADRAVQVGVRCAPWQEEGVARAIRGAAPEWEVVAGERMGGYWGTRGSEGTGSTATTDAPLWLVASLGRFPGPAGHDYQHSTGRIAGADWAPLFDVRACGTLDPLAALLEAVQPLGEAEWLIIRYLIRPAGSARRRRALEAITQPVPAASWAELLHDALAGGAPRVARYEPRLQRLLEERQAEPGFELQASVALAGGEQRPLSSRARSLSAVFGSRCDSGFGGLALHAWRWRSGSPGNAVRWDEGQPSLYVTAGEVAALWHAPTSGVRVPGVVYLKRPSVPLPVAVARGPGLLLGHHIDRGQRVPANVPRQDLVAGHLAAIGRTGVGKSTLEHRLARQLAREPDRPALCIVDPHGPLALDFARQSVPPGREADVVLLDLGDTAFPIGLPFFSAPPGVPQDALVQTTFSLMRLLFREQWSATRMADVAFAVTTTFCQPVGANLLDAARLFTDAAFRRRVVARLDDPAGLEFWAEYEHLSDAARRELYRPVLTRLRSLYRARATRNIVCQTQGVDFQALLDRGAIVLVSLAGPEIQADADLLGELVLARLQLVAMARMGRVEPQRPCFLIVDESQRFHGPSLPVLLTEGRKVGFVLIVASQFVHAWGEILAESIVNNVGTLVCFACGPDDSRRLSARLRPFTPEQLQDLDRHEAVAKVHVGGTSMPAFDFRVEPVPTPADDQLLARIRQQSRERYARPRDEVELRARNSDPFLRVPGDIGPTGRTRDDIDEE